MFDQVFDSCVNVLLLLSNLFGLTYKEINVIIFCIYMPLVLLILCFDNFQLRKSLKESGGQLKTNRRINIVIVLGFLSPFVLIQISKTHGVEDTATSLDVTLNASIMYKLSKGYYPKAIQDLIDEKYLDSYPKDEWGTRLTTSVENGNFFIMSLGPNKVKDQGLNDSDDIKWSEEIRQNLR